MNKIEQLHLDAIKYEEADCITQDGEYIKFVENCNYYDVTSKSAEITEQIAVEFGNFLFSKGIEYYDDLANGVNYTIEYRQGSFIMKELFQEFLKTKQ